MTTSAHASVNETASSIAPSVGLRHLGGKKRCWAFHVAGITREAAVGADDLLLSVRRKYRTIKTLVVNPPAEVNANEATTTNNVVVQVHFNGPQPSEGPGSLLCHLLSGTSVEARPVKLHRGRRGQRMDGHIASKKTCSGDFCATTRPHQHVFDRQISNHGSKKGDIELNDEQRRTKVVSKDRDTSEKSTHGDYGSDTPTQVSVDGDEQLSTDTQALPYVEQLQSTSSPALGTWGLKDNGLHWEDTPPRGRIAPVLHEDFIDTGVVCGDTDLNGDSEDISSTTKAEMDGVWDMDWIEAILDANNDAVRVPSPKGSRPPNAAYSFDAISIGGHDSGKAGSTPTGTLESGHIFNSAEAPVNITRGVGEWAKVPHVSPVRAANKQGGTLFGTQISVKVFPLENVIHAFPQQNRDFGGRTMSSRSTLDASVPTNRGYVEFMGLERARHGFRGLVVSVRFAVGSLHTVHQPPSPIKGEANGRMCAQLKYPSMQEIWPEVDLITNIRHVKVEVEVELRSVCGNFRYAAPKFEVAYVRVP